MSAPAGFETEGAFNSAGIHFETMVLPRRSFSGIMITNRILPLLMLLLKASYDFGSDMNLSTGRRLLLGAYTRELRVL